MRPPTQQKAHWYDAAIERAKVVSEALEVAKAWGAYIAEWVLLICLIMNIIQMFPIVPEVIGNIVLVVQAISLDIAGFGLTSMGAHARRNGNHKAALRASIMGWALIGLMILTVILVTVPFIWPNTKDFVAGCDKVMILLRVIVTVFYGHVVHSVRAENKAHAVQTANLEQELSTLRQEVDTLRPQVDTLNGQLQAKIREVDILRSQLSTAQQKLSTLQNDLDTGESDNSALRKQLKEAQIEAESLRTQLEGKKLEAEGLRELLEKGQDWQGSRLASLQQELESEQTTSAQLRRQLNTLQLDAETLRLQLENKQREVERVQSELATSQQEVSTLRQRVSTLQQKVDSGQASSGRAKASTGHTQKVDSGHEGVDSGQGKVVRLDATRSRKSQDDEELAERIKDMLLSNPQLSDRSIAKQLQCSPTTVGRKRAAMGLAKNEGSAVNE